MRVLAKHRVIRTERCNTSSLFPHINQPCYAKPVEQDSKSLCPERLLKLHLHRTILREAIENALPFHRVLKFNIQREPLGHAVQLRRHVCSLEHVVAEDKRYMVNLITPSDRV